MQINPQPEPNHLWDESKFASSDEGPPLPFHAGEEIIAVMWVGPIYEMTNRPSPGGGKKG
jgi:hypothetical protein